MVPESYSLLAALFVGALIIGAAIAIACGAVTRLVLRMETTGPRVATDGVLGCVGVGLFVTVFMRFDAPPRVMDSVGLATPALLVCLHEAYRYARRPSRR